jgi:hypothetical protein
MQVQQSCGRCSSDGCENFNPAAMRLWISSTPQNRQGLLSPAPLEAAAAAGSVSCHVQSAPSAHVNLLLTPFSPAISLSSAASQRPGRCCSSMRSCVKSMERLVPKIGSGSTWITRCPALFSSCQSLERHWDMHSYNAFHGMTAGALHPGLCAQSAGDSGNAQTQSCTESQHCN